jgi:vacuolar protein sorting-associated protein IST1
MAVSRLRIHSNKKSALVQTQMQQVSKLLSETPPKEEKARIKTESIVRDDDTIEAYELLQLQCEIISQRIQFIASKKEIPDDLKSTIATLIWASTRIDVPELKVVRSQFKSKYGKKFDEEASLGNSGIVNERIMAKLSVVPPNAFLVQTYLEKIAEKYDLDWKPTTSANSLNYSQMQNPMPAPMGFSVPAAAGSGFTPATAPPTAIQATVVDEQVYPDINGGKIDEVNHGSVGYSSLPPVDPPQMPNTNNYKRSGDDDDDDDNHNSNDDQSASTYGDLQRRFNDLNK